MACPESPGSTPAGSPVIYGMQAPCPARSERPARAALLAAARAEPGTSGVDLVSEVTTELPYTVGTGPRRVVAYDLGIKSTILRLPTGELATVTVVPAHTGAAEVLASEPHGVFLSNGPGDPELAGPVIARRCGAFVGEVPGLRDLPGPPAAGTVPRRAHLQDALRPSRRQCARPMHRHRPHRDHQPEPQLRGGGRFGAERDRDSRVPQRQRLWRALTVDGEAAFGVQYHPEAGPGPHDARHHFANFAEMMDRCRAAA